MFAHLVDIEKAMLEDSYKVYFGIIHSAEHIFKGYPCDIIKSPNIYFRRPVALPIRNGSPYLKLFRKRIQYYKEYGITNNMEGLKKGSKADIKCEANKLNKLGYKNIFSSFLALGIGLLFAILLSCVEFLTNKLKR